MADNDVFYDDNGQIRLSGTLLSGGVRVFPAQWVIDPNTGGLTITLTGAAHHADFANALTIKNADGNTLLTLDSGGDFIQYFRDVDAVSGTFWLPTAVVPSSEASLLGVYWEAQGNSSWYISAYDFTETMQSVPTPTDGAIGSTFAKSWYDSTNGAARFVRRGKTANGTIVQTVAPMAPPITSGALPTATLVSGTGAQIALNRNAETITPVTFNPGAATTATCTVALSPDNVTYSTLGVETEPAGVAFDGTIHLIKVMVPAGWYLKLTVNAQATLGTTTYYS